MVALLAITCQTASAQEPPRRPSPPGAMGDAVVKRDVEYARAGGRPLKLDLYVPRAVTRPDARPVPLVVWVHGGGWRAGSKERTPATVLLSHGYAVASVEYRLTGVAPFPAQIHDVKAAIRFLRANAAASNIDPDRIGAWGGSAGGHLVALLGTTADVPELEGELGEHAGVSSRVQAVCDFCGPSNLLTAVDQGLEGGRGSRTLEALLGGPVPEKRDLARLASPVFHASAGDAPFLIYHGDQDRVVPLAQSRELVAALTKAGVEVTFVAVPGAGHNVGEGVRRDPALARGLIEFFDRHLKAPPRPATRPTVR